MTVLPCPKFAPPSNRVKGAVAEVKEERLDVGAEDKRNHQAPSQFNR